MPLITLSREEIVSIPAATPESPVIIATGPLTSPALSAAIVQLVGDEHLYFYDAISPIVLAETINMNVEKQLWQIDTGPIALPDLSQRHERPIDSLRLAFVAANRFDEAYFVVEQPTPIMDGDKVVTEVRHYSKPFALKVTNVLLADPS